MVSNGYKWYYSVPQLGNLSHTTELALIGLDPLIDRVRIPFLRPTPWAFKSTVPAIMITATSTFTYV